VIGLVTIPALVWLATEGPTAIEQAQAPRALRASTVAQWLELVNEHQPGQMDDALRRLQTWTDAQLQQLSLGLVEALSRTGQLPDKIPGDRRSVIRRGAAMHADLAMLARSPNALTSVPLRPTSLSVVVDDGQQTGFATNSIHWEIGRVLIDLLEPQHLRDPLVSLWYRAAAEFMIATGDYASTQSHLACAQRMLADETHVWLASGVVRAYYATPSVQNAMAGVKIPFGFYVMVDDQKRELDSAERFLRRAVDLDPGNAEAQLRYGWVLVQKGRFDPAFDALHAARAAAKDPVLQYYATLFLGAAESAVGRHAAAAEQFEQAMQPFPTAQAPLLALSELALRRGDRAMASTALQRLLALPSETRDDPWWTYSPEYGRHWRTSWNRVVELLDQPFPPPGQPGGSPCQRR
jgi:tetratricopeptide (TPR) repeat protein